MAPTQKWQFCAGLTVLNFNPERFRGSHQTKPINVLVKATSKN